MWRRVERSSATSLNLHAPVPPRGRMGHSNAGEARSRPDRSRAARTYQLTSQANKGRVEPRRTGRTGREGSRPQVSPVELRNRGSRPPRDPDPGHRTRSTRCERARHHRRLGRSPRVRPRPRDHHPDRTAHRCRDPTHFGARAIPSGGCVEADFPAQHSEAQEEARLPTPDAHPCGPRRDQAPAPSGPGQALGLIRRVRGRENFRALAGARRHRAGPVAIQVLRGDDAIPPAVAYAIGRPVGPAVVRNRLRRRLREVVRARRDLLEPGCAYLLGAGAGAVAMSPAELERAVVATLRRAAEVS